MDTTLARHLAARVAELIELASIFQCRYGKDYRLKPGSPTDAWDLHQSIIDQQTAIAGLLDTYAIETPAQRVPQWWKNQDIMDTSTATSLAQEVCHLIAACACVDANPERVSSPVIASLQQVIAGTLHPSTRMMAMAKAS